MSKKTVRIAVLVLLGVLLAILPGLVGCGEGVSQKEYDALAAELAATREQVTGLQAQYDALAAELAAAQQQVASLQAQLDIPVFQGLALVSLEDGVYHLSWIAATDNDTGQASIRYDVFESEQPGVENYDFPNPVASIVGATSIGVSGLDVTSPHYFIVRAVDRDGTSDQNTIEQTDRALHLTGAPNFRDLGGYINSDGKQIKWGLIYRSDDLTKLTDDDMARVNDLGLKRIVDLRHDKDIQRDGYDRTYAGNEAMYDLVPFNYGDPYLLEMEEAFQLTWDLRQVDFPNWYINVLEANKDGIREVFERYADPAQYPMLVHCSQGKDRAGVISALLLSLLHVPKTTIIEDYMLTSELVDIPKKIRDMQGYLELFADIVPEGVTVVDWMPLLSCVPDSMKNLLDYIDTEYNGVEGFLESIGITSGQQQAIRDVLLKD
jgi:protein-tyrosine phosphatase